MRLNALGAHISETGVYRLIHARQIPAVKLNRWYVKDLEAWLDTQGLTQAQEPVTLDTAREPVQVESPKPIVIRDSRRRFGVPDRSRRSTVPA
jgi:hypothetical protein